LILSATLQSIAFVLAKYSPDDLCVLISLGVEFSNENSSYSLSDKKCSIHALCAWSLSSVVFADRNEHCSFEGCRSELGVVDLSKQTAPTPWLASARSRPEVLNGLGHGARGDKAWGAK
jgi:hypothetical protein